MASTFAHTVIDKAEEFFPVVVEHFKDNVIKSMSDSLETLRTQYPQRHVEVSQKWRDIVAAVEPHLAFVQPAGGRKKRTTRRRKHKHSK